MDKFKVLPRYRGNTSQYRRAFGSQSNCCSRSTRRAAIARFHPGNRLVCCVGEVSNPPYACPVLPSGRLPQRTSRRTMLRDCLDPGCGIAATKKAFAASKPANQAGKTPPRLARRTRQPARSCPAGPRNTAIETTYPSHPRNVPPTVHLTFSACCPTRPAIPPPTSATAIN